MKKILINDAPWQTRVAITNEHGLQNIYFWSHASNQLERSFYKGKVTKVLPGIQTAFVDIGEEKAGFMHISEIDRELAINRMSQNFGGLDSTEKAPSEKKQQADISKILKEGDSLLVQVTKEPVDQKGAKLTTCFTLPGRFLVLMPSIPRIAISKKIEEREERARLRDLLMAQLPEGMGAIIRTCAEHRTAEEIGHDVSFLVETWNTILAHEKEAIAPAKIYQDLDLAFQIVRDHLDSDIEEVLCDNPETVKKLVKFVKSMGPEHVHKIKEYVGHAPLFEKYDIEKQIKDCLRKKVDLKSGGSIVIEATEAMTVVDVNTGRFIGKTNMEDTILKTNMEAAQEVTRQLKVRNIGGLIVIDFIDMANYSNRQKLFKFFEKTLKEQDKFQSVLLKISEFGLVQMTRKRSGKTLARQLTDPCAHCSGSGLTPSVQAESYALLRVLTQELESKKIKGDNTIRLNPAIFDYISRTEYNTILNFEKELGGKITLESDVTLPIGSFTIHKV